MTLELIEAILLNVTLRRDMNNLDFQTFGDEKWHLYFKITNSSPLFDSNISFQFFS